MKKYRLLLENALQYAVEHGSWSKQLLTAKADVVCAYGLGKYFRDAFYQWHFRDVYHVNYCCDRDIEHGKRVAQEYELNFLDINDLLKMNKEKRVIVILFMGDYYEQMKEFVTKGLYCIIPQDCIFEEIGSMPNDEDWFSNNQILETYDSLEDDLSKKIYSNILARRIALPLADYTYSDLRSENQYFLQDFFDLSKEEVFCDCGAFNGDTLWSFLDVVNGFCKYIYAYELADDNFDELERAAKEMERKYPSFTSSHYKLIHAGVWDHKTKIPFGKENAAPRESYAFYKKNSNNLLTYVDAVTIDESTDIPVTFIKMDIEGAELNALRGGAGQIRQNRPKLAICVYHRLHDLWEIPMYIKSLVPEYKLYLRHHTVSLGDTVLYAVCDD